MSIEQTFSNIEEAIKGLDAMGNHQSQVISNLIGLICTMMEELSVKLAREYNPKLFEALRPMLLDMTEEQRQRAEMFIDLVNTTSKPGGQADLIKVMLQRDQ